MTLTELIERLERAKGPDRGIDGDIWTIETRRKYPDPDDPDILWDVHHRIVDRLKAGGNDDECPFYTSSIDAALTLVPEGYLPRLYRYTDPFWGADVYTVKSDAVWGSRSETPAIALCIASLKARATVLDEGKV